MEQFQERIAEGLLKTGSVQVYRDRPFVFVSGRVSPVYVDCRRLLSFPEVREVIVEQLAIKVKSDIGLEVIDVVAGGETAGIPYAAFVSLKVGKPMIYVRSGGSDYGRNE
jgi:orotate phosphoribosyltransferase